MPEETTPTTEPTTEPPKPQGLDAYLESLDDDGRKVVKAELDKARREAATYRGRARDAEARVAQIAQTQQTEEQTRTAQEAATAQRLQALVEKSARAEIKALAADKFADPDDAAVHLKASDYIDENGDVRSYELAAAIDDLLTRKPHLAKQAQRQTRQPAPDQGQGRGGAGAATEPRDVFAGWLNQQLGGRLGPQQPQ